MRTAKALGMYRVKVLSVAAGGLVSCGFTLFVLEGDVYSCGGVGQDANWMPPLGHGGEGTSECRGSSRH